MPLTTQQARENGLKGGRPLGTQTPENRLRARTYRRFLHRVYRGAGRLFHAQMAEAEGLTFLYFRPTQGAKSEVVKDPETIRKYFDGELEKAENGSAGYYYVVAERPSAMAADRLLNRAYGKPAETHKLEHTGEGGGPVQVQIAIVAAVKTIE